MANEPDPAVSPIDSAGPSSRGAPLSLLWATAVVLGALLLLWQFGSTVWRVLIPLATMAAYVAVGRSRARTGLQDFADSVYFMGFLWSVWVLVVGTAFSSHGQPLRADELQSLFGYSLITTGAGMFARNILLQHDADSRSLTEAEDPMEGARRLGRALNHAATHAEAASARLQVALKAFQHDIQASSDAFRSAAQTAGVDGALAVKREMELAGAAISQALRAPLPPAEEIATSLGRLAVTLDETTAVLKDDFSALRRAVTSATSKTGAKWEEASAALVDGAERARDASQMMQAAAGSTAAAVASLASLTQEVLDLTRTIAVMKEDIGSATAAARAHVQVELEHADSAMGDLRVAAEALFQATRELAHRLR